MEDNIYEDLENYNEVNVIEELRSENNELRFKLDEYSSAMSALQNDFDKLNSEYRKLELNFTSLLKTARAEIERKTLMISQLNKEKDILVIQSIEKTGRNILKNVVCGSDSHTSGKSKKYNTTTRKDETSSFNAQKNRLTPSNLETIDFARGESRLMSPMGSTSSVGANTKSVSSESIVKNTTCEKGSRESKNNVLKKLLQQQEKDNDDIKSNKITNRRKSMPIASQLDPIFSSDEELLDHFAGDKYVRSRNVRDNKRNSGCSRRSYRMPEPSDKDTRNRYTSDKTYRDRNNSHQRLYSTYRRHSPENDSYRSHKLHGHHRKADNRNHRDLETKSRDRRYHERDYDRCSTKHKRNSYDLDELGIVKEPDPKRRKVESVCTDTHNKDDIKDINSYHSTEAKSNEVVEIGYGISCQSPENNQMEPNATQFVKEIRSTATMTIEDPRLSSEKYTVKNTNEGNFLMTTVNNVEIRPIDKSRWGMERVEVPEALKKIVPYLYDKEQNPLCNVTVESGEISCDDLDEEQVPDTYKSNIKKNNYNTLERDLPTALERITHVCNDESKTKLSHYKIPKHYQTEPGSNYILNKLNDNKHNKEKVKRSSHEKLSIKESLAGDLELSDEASDEGDEHQIVDNKGDSLKSVIREEKDPYKNKEAPTNLRFIEYNTDVRENREEYVREKLEMECKEATTQKLDLSQDKKLQSEAIEILSEKIKGNSIKPSKKECKDNISLKLQENKELGEGINTKVLTEKCQDKTFRQTKDCKEKNKKKQDLLSNGIVFENKISTEIEKKQKRKKSKKKGKDPETDSGIVSKIDNSCNTNKESIPINKFTELFGESTSLITPDDLVIPSNIETKRVNDNKEITSVFDESTCDAIDLNIKEIQKLKNTEEDDFNMLNLKNDPIQDQIVKISETSENIYKNLSLNQNDKDSVNNILYQNLKSQVSHDPDVVKTIVVSSGVQANIENNHEITQVRNPTLCKNEMENLVNKNSKPLNLLQALATSTPHKVHTDVESLSSTNYNSTLNAGDIKVANMSGANACNTNVDLPESTAPDVRIFVKRRKRGKKTI